MLTVSLYFEVTNYKFHVFLTIEDGVNSHVKICVKFSVIFKYSIVCLRFQQLFTCSAMNQCEAASQI